MATSERVATDWAAYRRQAARKAVKDAPVVPVRVVFHPHGLAGEPAWTEWPGQVYGSLAVVQEGDLPPGVEDRRTGPRGWQLVHVPTGRWLDACFTAGPLRMLALALGATAVDWARVGSAGAREQPGADEARRVMQEGVSRE